MTRTVVGRGRVRGIPSGYTDGSWRTRWRSVVDTISSSIPGRPTSRTASCGRWTAERSTSPARSSRRSPRNALPASSGCSRPTQTILAYAASGHGAWEAALVNLFSPGDKLLVVESGFFSLNWGMRGEAFGLEVETLPNDWRSAADPGQARKPAARGSRARDQGGAGGAQRDLDRRLQRHRRDCAARSMPPGTRRCSSSTRSRPWRRWISAWTNGASMSSSPARRRG